MNSIDNYNNFKRPFIIMKGRLVQPSFSDLSQRIQQQGDNKEEPLLNQTILSIFGYTYKYDKLRKCIHARLPYMSLWWDDQKKLFYALILNSKFELKYLIDFQRCFCLFFCYKFKPGYDFHFLDMIISLDRGQFLKYNDGDEIKCIVP